MLKGLTAKALCGRDDQKHGSRPRRAADHGADIVLMAGGIDQVEHDPALRGMGKA